jgi:hypothetical protein
MMHIIGIEIIRAVWLIGIIPVVLWRLRLSDRERIVEGRNVKELSLKSGLMLASHYLVLSFEVVQQVSLVLNVQHFADGQVLQGSRPLEYFLEE